MRIFYLLFSLFIFCGLLNAQTVKIEYSGDPLPDKDRRNIEEFISHEVNFYTQFGLPDTLTLQLLVFENRKEALAYLESVNISFPRHSKRAAYIRRNYKRQSYWDGRKDGNEALP